VEKLIINASTPLPETTQNRSNSFLTWDKAIVTTEKAHRRQPAARKKALMQQLLTGKKRIGWVSEEWERYSLGNFGFY